MKNLIKRFTARIFEDENRPSFMTCERERFGCPFRIYFGCERVFVLQPPEALRRRIFYCWGQY
jgi:hypothetical protein